MNFERDQNRRRQREMAYHSELRQQIDLKNSQILLKPQRFPNNKPQSFSLLKNVEIEQQNRKNKQSFYYAELRSQIQIQKQQKKRKKDQEARRQREEEEKIRRDNQLLNQRAMMEKMQQTKKKGPQQNNDPFNKVPENVNKLANRPKIQQTSTIQNKRPNIQQNYRQQSQQDLQKNYYSRTKTSQSQKDSSELPINTYQSFEQIQRKPHGPYSMSQLPTYTNRVQNQPFNFLPQRKYMDSYFQQLLGERRRFQQQAMGIYELNKLFLQEKGRAGKIESRGLNELKKLQGLLDEKGENYMVGHSGVRNYDQYDSLKKLTIPSFQNSSMSESGWRKLD